MKREKIVKRGKEKNGTETERGRTQRGEEKIRVVGTK